MQKPIKYIVCTGLVLNIILALIKLTFGILGNSFSLMTDGINSAVDIFISILLLVSLHIASKKSDANHPYGHEKYEVIVSLILGILLIVTSAIIIVTGISEFNNNAVIEPYTLIVALLSICLKAVILCTNIYGYKKYGQVSLKADALNHLGDILATAMSFIGIILSLYTPLQYFDYMAAFVIAGLIFYNGIKVIKESISMLVDEAPSKAFNNEVQTFIKALPGVLSLDDYKARLHVNKVYIDVEIGVDKALSLLEAHEIAEIVHLHVEATFAQVLHCMVHVNPHFADEITK